MATTVIPKFDYDFLFSFSKMFEVEQHADTQRLFFDNDSKGKCANLDSKTKVLIKQLFERQLVKFLMQVGGWKNEQRIRNHEGFSVVSGSVFDGYKGPWLSFTDFSIKVISCIFTGGDDKKENWPSNSIFSDGDHVIFFLFNRMVKGLRRNLNTGVIQRIIKNSTDVHGTNLLHGTNLAFAINHLVLLSDSGSIGMSFLSDFLPLMNGSLSVVLDSIQDSLFYSWQTMENSKSSIKNYHDMIAVGKNQSEILKAYIDSCHKTYRYDLLRWVFRLISHLISIGYDYAFFCSSINFDGCRLADRQASYEAATSVIQSIYQLQKINQENYSVGFMDHNYKQSQFWKQMWERYNGDNLVSKVNSVMEAIDPLRISSSKTGN